MPTVEPISVINVDDTPIAVEGCSDTVKQLVSVYNEWRQKEANDKDTLMLTQAGLRDVTREIVVTVRKEQEEAAAAAAAEASNDEAPADTRMEETNDAEDVVVEDVVVEDVVVEDDDADA